MNRIHFALLWVTLAPTITAAERPNIVYILANDKDKTIVKNLETSKDARDSTTLQFLE